MFRAVFIFSLSVLLGSGSEILRECECPDVDSPQGSCSLGDKTLLQLDERAEILSSSHEILASGLKEVTTCLAQNTEVLNKLKTELSRNPLPNGNSGSPSPDTHAKLTRTRFYDHSYPSSCAGAAGKFRTSGLYTIQENAPLAKPFLVYCNEDVDGGGWTVIQRRVDGSIDFYRDWNSYKIGFGNLIGNFFIGLDRLHALTKEPQELLIILKDFEGIKQTAKYDRFEIGDENEFYKLKVLGKFTGYIGDSLYYHKGMYFSTKDKNNNAMTTRDCPNELKGGWWYNDCHRSNLNGVYLKRFANKAPEGIIWYNWHGWNYSFKSVEMLIRPRRGEECSTKLTYPTSCDDASLRESGIVVIQLPTSIAEPFKVYCDEDEYGGGWTVIQRRVDDSVDFYRDWAAYKEGFGELSGNFFIGLDKLHALTSVIPQELWITMEDFENVTKYAKYDDFAIGDETESYLLKVLGKYSGTAGDSFSRHKNMKFSTKDRDNDLVPQNCALAFKGAWWYSGCHDSNLNGAYGDKNFGRGITWFTWHGHYYPLKTASMMIRPKRH